MERRANIRVPFTIDAVVRCGDRSISGTLLNISLRGMYIELAEEVPVHAAITVEIVLETGNERIACTLPGEVIRSESRGTAVKLVRMGLDSYITVRDLMMNSARDPKSVMDEFHLFIKENSIN